MTPPGRRHQRQGGGEDVAVAVEVHREHAAPVVVAALGEAGRTADTGDVDDGVQAAELVGQLAGTTAVLPASSVTDTPDARAAPPAATMRPAVVSLGRGELLGAVDGDQRVDGDDESACAGD